MSTRHDPNGLRDLLRTDPPAESVVDFIGYQRAGRIAVLTLARPDRHNALNLAAWRRLGELAASLSADEELRAVVIRGAGTRAFSAGADIDEFPTQRMTARTAARYGDAIASALTAVAAMPVPVLAVIDGLAVGGGLELSAACDLRIASEVSRFGIPIGRLGVTLGLAETTALSQLVGPSELKYLLFSGRLIDAVHALRIGLVQSVVPADVLLDEVLDLVAAIMTASVPTLRAAKAVTAMTTRNLTADDTQLLARIAVEVYDGPDLAEGVAAFNEGRSPEFPSQTMHVLTTEVL
ncbi:enoyl-CoA hydratase/isomerase family protein [Nocardioides sp. AN3]